MQRLSGALRRAERIISWRAALSGAGNTPRAAGIAAPDDLHGRVAGAVLASAARSSSSSSTAAALEHRNVVCACVLERLPIVLPQQPAWEAEYQARCTVQRACGSASQLQARAW
jgi:hypothetical protein